MTSSIHSDLNTKLSTVGKFQAMCVRTIKHNNKLSTRKGHTLAYLSASVTVISTIAIYNEKKVKDFDFFVL